jgi:uncharacterized protein
MRILNALLFLFVSLTANAQIFTVETVPNTKLVNNSYVSDPTHILHDTTASRINQILGDLENKATAQVAVVVLPSIGEADRFEFAQRLFEHWGIGQAEKDNGLLILFILDQRNIRFHTGYGLEGILSDARCKQIQQQFMVPSFKEGDYNAGMLLGIEKVAALLTTPEAIDEIFVEDKPAESRYLYVTLSITYLIFLVVMFLVTWTNDKFDQATYTPRIILSKKRWFFLYGILPLTLCWAAFQLDLSYAIFFLLAYALIISLFLERYHRIYTTISEPFIKKNKYQALHNFYQNHHGYWLGAAIFFFIPMFFVYRAYQKKRKFFRDQPRPCKKCGKPTQKLSEKTEDEVLSSGQIAEENLGVIDYDVWKCNACGSTEILNYPNKTTNYTRCPKCNYLTYHFGSRRTVKSATYTSEGLSEEVRNCKHCGHQHIDTIAIAMLVAAASSWDNDSSSSSSDSSSSSGSSSSSDSGGDWGGGDSGGGGSDSSW